MPRFFRRILFSLFLTLFFISATALLFYASGYRYHAGKKIIEKTGKLIVETSPRGARLLLNGAQSESLQTPASISYLLSGEYELTVEKQGFFPATRRITIAPGMSTVINNIILIKQEDPRLLFSRAVPTRALQRADTIVISGGNVLNAFDIRAMQGRDIFSSHEPIEEIRISNEGTLFAYRTRSGWHIRSADHDIFDEKPGSAPILDMQFADETNNLIARTAEGLLRFDFTKKTFDVLTRRQGIRSFFVTGNSLFLLSKIGGEKDILEEVRLSDGAVVRSISDIPAMRDFSERSNGTLVLRGEQDTLYLFDRMAEHSTFQEIRDARALAFTNEGRFFSFNDFEVWEHIYSKEHYSRSLVTRQSTPITAILPFKTRAILVIVSRDGSVRLLGLDTKEHTQLSLASFARASAVFTDQKEKTLFIVGSYNGAEGLFGLSLIEEEQVFPLLK